MGLSSCLGWSFHDWSQTFLQKQPSWVCALQEAQHEALTSKWKSSTKERDTCDFQMTERKKLSTDQGDHFRSGLNVSDALPLMIFQLMSFFSPKSIYIMLQHHGNKLFICSLEFTAVLLPCSFPELFRSVAFNWSICSQFGAADFGS